MKKLLVLLTVLLGMYTMNAQGWGVSVSGGYLTEIAGIGFSADVIYDITEKFGVSTDVTYSVADVGSTRAKWFAVDLNGHYKVIEEFYLLAGGEYLNVTLKELGLGGGSPLNNKSTTSGSEFGFNLGTGYKYNLINNVNIFAEAKYVIMDVSYFHARLGLQFDF